MSKLRNGNICGYEVNIYTENDFETLHKQRSLFLPWNFNSQEQISRPPSTRVDYPLYPTGDPVKSANSNDGTGGVIYFDYCELSTLLDLLKLLKVEHLGKQYLVFHDECKGNSLQEKYLEQIRIVSPRELVEWGLISKDQKYKDQLITATQAIVNFISLQKVHYDSYQLHAKCGMRKKDQGMGDDALSLGFGICVEASCCCNYRYRIWSRHWWSSP